MAALIIPVVGPDTTPDDIKQALTGLAHDAARMLSRDALGYLSDDHGRMHAGINDLLDELVARLLT